MQQSEALMNPWKDRDTEVAVGEMLKSTRNSFPEILKEGRAFDVKACLMCCYPTATTFCSCAFLSDSRFTASSL